MKMPELTCQDERRRDRVRGMAKKRADYNGLDYLEVSEDQRTLTVYFLVKAPEGLKVENVRITGGRRIRDIQVVRLWECRQDDPELDDCVRIRVDKPGDFSTYTLCLVDLDEHGRQTDNPFPGLDPRYACLDFGFKANCPSDLDCRTERICPPPERIEPEINYLAKDYASFRQLILDRLSLVMPGWQERHVPDLGIALVELLAYAGDHLSYYQDAVATEAYLHTARQRISVRRHARLVDYAVHEGCNARAWVHVDAEDDIKLSPDEIVFVTGYNDVLPVRSTLLTQQELAKIPPDQYEVFQPLVEEPGSPYFALRDLKDATCLALKLREAADTMSAYLMKRFSEPLREGLKRYEGPGAPSAKLQKALVEQLNRLIQEAGFAAERSSGKTPQQKPGLPEGEALVRWNRSLLEEAFPQELARIRQPGEPLRLYKAHSTMSLYTWGDRECCLPRGTTRAWLKDEWVLLDDGSAEAGQLVQQLDVQQKGAKVPRAFDPRCMMRKLRHLQPGDVLILEEVIGPKTGNPADADPTYRHAVRLTEVRYDVDPIGRGLAEDGSLGPQPIVEIAWDEADALPFPICISVIGPAPGCEMIEDISVARGNVVLVDHGRRVEADDDEKLWCVPLMEKRVECEGEGRSTDLVQVPARFRPPPLRRTPLTFSQALPSGAPASAMLAQDPRQAVPWIRLTSAFDPLCGSTQGEEAGSPPSEQAAEVNDTEAVQQTDKVAQEIDEAVKQTELREEPDVPVTEGEDLADPVAIDTWTAQRDLLASGPFDRHFVVEIDNEGRGHLRFGDGELGKAPEAETRFHAVYRTGNGPVGNVGAEAITHIVSKHIITGVTLRPRNPLPSQGGMAPESIQDVKLFAPHTFRRYQQRAITAEDYARIVMRDFADKVQRAAATLRWMGSWYEVLVAVDPLGEVGADQDLLDEIQGHLYRFRRIGHDVEVRPARLVALDIEMTICVLPDYLRGHVKAALLDLFSNRRLPGGQLGFFHPDNLTFGEGVQLSRLVALTRSVEGVENAVVTKLERLYEGPNGELDAGLLPLSPLEIARLDNDPSMPENGRLKLKMEGGR